MISRMKCNGIMTSCIFIALINDLAMNNHKSNMSNRLSTRKSIAANMLSPNGPLNVLS